MEIQRHTLLLALFAALFAAVLSGWLLYSMTSSSVFWAVVVTDLVCCPVGVACASRLLGPSAHQRRESLCLLCGAGLSMLCGCTIVLLNRLADDEVAGEELISEKSVRAFIAVTGISLAEALLLFLLHLGVKQEAVQLRRISRKVQQTMNWLPQPRLKLVDSFEDISAEGTIECAICLESFASLPPELTRAPSRQRFARQANLWGLGLLQLPCGHAFHAGCMERWMECRASCPCCRLPVGSVERCTCICLRSPPPPGPGDATRPQEPRAQSADPCGSDSSPDDSSASSSPIRPCLQVVSNEENHWQAVRLGGGLAQLNLSSLGGGPPSQAVGAPTSSQAGRTPPTSPRSQVPDRQKAPEAAPHRSPSPPISPRSPRGTPLPLYRQTSPGPAEAERQWSRSSPPISPRSPRGTPLPLYRQTSPGAAEGPPISPRSPRGTPLPLYRQTSPGPAEAARQRTRSPQRSPRSRSREPSAPPHRPSPAAPAAPLHRPSPSAPPRSPRSPRRPSAQKPSEPEEPPGSWRPHLPPVARGARRGDPHPEDMCDDLAEEGVAQRVPVMLSCDE